ncbi:UPF0118 membrane protein YueF [Paenibacillus cisolokensis]|uniref:UPF0118 membrane protein YueF n=1 Tax=Paenibacillus cisolokensis TaxID=1658519 RepID=A0ABQ4N917_9BACL|nr:AI-2E family transporter [Paenibacillus cisolokensis]GIQ64670.1 UPF0118 membrane protein YueF [Paenibacillus cisolokensis]
MKIGRFYQVCISIILVLIIIYLLDKVGFVFRPLVAAFNIVMLPLLFSVFLYYLLRPSVRWLHRRKLNKSAAILLLYLVFGGLTALISTLAWPTLQAQFTSFTNNLPVLLTDLQTQLERLREHAWFRAADPGKLDLSSNLTEYIGRAFNQVTSYITNAVSVLTNVVLIVSTVPVLAYYMLKEDRKAYDALKKRLPGKYRAAVVETLRDMDKVMSEFILGRIILSFLLGIMIYIGFLLIGLPYSLMLALLLAALNMIPYVGQIIGLIPCLIIAFIDGPSTVIGVLIVNVTAQQIEGNLLSPHIYGRKLDIHPLTTILILLAGGSAFGIIGIMFAIPAYLILKIVASRLFRHYAAESQYS